ncbi:hypothetical protein GN244_ATG20761 [Phytophthora infestans]|uniref:Uncharacterized protein n=1 Tax=Phytophthora infestans TaxID=4787 RepID=A0A833SNJ8_PHYIN|nr:hypothetical protein GN244_ATG20761 [Phytophthora infestans]
MKEDVQCKDQERAQPPGDCETRYDDRTIRRRDWCGDEQRQDASTVRLHIRLKRAQSVVRRPGPEGVRATPTTRRVYHTGAVGASKARKAVKRQQIETSGGRRRVRSQAAAEEHCVDGKRQAARRQEQDKATQELEARRAVRETKRWCGVVTNRRSPISPAAAGIEGAGR